MLNISFPTYVYINTIDGYLLGFNTSNFILPVYPTFTYGDPAIYALWLSLNPWRHNECFYHNHNLINNHEARMGLLWYGPL